MRAERWRLALLTFCIAFVFLTWLLRRASGDVVASSNAGFIPVISILGASLILLGCSIVEVSWRIKRGLLLPWWRASIGTILDLAVPFSVLLVLQFESPRGAYTALSGPTLLIVPIVILLSVLRLQPRFSLLIGLAAAAAHWGLTASAVHRQSLDASVIPSLATYGVLLALTGIAAAALSTFVRRYVQEATAEAAEAERAGRKLTEIELELDIARDIQQSLLPSEPPVLAGFDIAGMARPAAHAGGDYFDWQPLSDGRLVVAIADVTGHGIGPALVMAVCRAYSRATNATATSPGDFLERMNAFIVKDVLDGRFITMAYAIVGADGVVELLSAGHGPTLWFHAATGEIEEFGGDGLPLGVADGELYTPTRILKMDRGDVLLLITDGFFERANAKNQLFGIDSLRDAVAKNASLPARDLIAAIDAEVAAFAGAAPQTDDMTVVVLRRT